jgi:hypothetical protein
VLIPRYGALGAAIATASTLVAHNVLKQIGLRVGTGVSLFEARYLSVYVSVGVVATALVLARATIAPDAYAAFVLAALASAVVLVFNRRTLRLGQTFPELLRLPLARRLFGEG